MFIGRRGDRRVKGDPMADEKHTVRLHRVMKCPAERLYRALTDPRALVKWMAPHGFVAEVHSMDAKAGGGYRMSFTNFSTGHSHSFGGKYIELKPNELLRYTDKFEDPNLPGEMSMTVRLKPVLGGSATELSIVQENIPAVIPVEACYLGWQESLSMLARLVEAEIPDEV
jgi:uncharacterized protein YndB with AHSA1/START domain